MLGLQFSSEAFKQQEPSWLYIDVAEGESSFERRGRGTLRNQLLPDEACIAGGGDGAYDRGITQLLGLVKLVPARIAGSMVMADAVMMRANGADDITFHDLHVINIVEQLDTWGIDHSDDLSTPVCVVALVITVIHLAVEQLQHEGHAGVLGHPCDAAHAFGRNRSPILVRQPCSIAAETDQVRDAPLRGEIDPRTKHHHETDCLMRAMRYSL